MHNKMNKKEYHEITGGRGGHDGAHGHNEMKKIEDTHTRKRL